jgi:hypothetical protein
MVGVPEPEDPEPLFELEEPDDPEEPPLPEEPDELVVATVPTEEITPGVVWLSGRVMVTLSPTFTSDR